MVTECIFSNNSNIIMADVLKKSGFQANNYLPITVGCEP